MKFLFKLIAELIELFSDLGNLDLIAVLWHVGALAVIALFVILVRVTQPVVKDLKAMNPVVKGIRLLLPYLAVVLVVLFFLINVQFVGMQYEDFFLRWGFRLIAAAYLSAVILIYRFADLNGETAAHVLAVVFGIYTVVKNIILATGVINFILREVLAAAIILVSLKIYWEFVDYCDPVQHRELSEAEKARLQAMWKAEAELRDQQKLARQMAKAERIFNQATGGGTSRSSAGSSFMDAYEDRRELKNVGQSNTIRNCANCGYLNNGICNNPASGAFHSQIYNASDHRCGHHEY